MLHHLTKPRTKQLSLFTPTAPVRRPDAGSAPNARERGAVFTRRETVDFILDLSGYTTDKPLYRLRLLEPSFGRGDFLLPVVERLLTAYNANHTKDANPLTDLSDAIRAVEIDPASIAETRSALYRLLTSSNITPETAEWLLAAWIVEGDFLLAPLPGQFTFAVGNPPYVRQELIPNELMAVYRELYDTIYDRADLYIPFIERCLKLLEPGGTLGFICADRWMKNRYGGPLRSLVAGGYHLKFYVDMVDTPAFHSEVSAYPAITVITREKPGATRMAHRPLMEHSSLQRLTASLKSFVLSGDDDISEVALVTNGAEPWMLNSFDQVALVRRLEQEYPSLEEAGCRVGIGVATGADRVFIGAYQDLDVEDECKLPLVTTAGIKNGSVVWQGKGVINPFRDDGGLVDLADFPRLAAYSTRMRGGYLRFQAQYLRRIRIPRWRDVSVTLRETLLKAALDGAVDACQQVVFDLYGMTNTNSKSKRYLRWIVFGSSTY